jgi:hypothetical protein
MGTNIPSNIPELINWCNTHGTLWSTNAVQINLTPAQATAFGTLVSALNKANTDAETARMASKDATLALRAAIDAARSVASIYVSTIKNYAQSTNNMNVYSLGGVSPADAPGTAPSPVAPQQFTAGVNPDGSLTIKWKVSQPAGLYGVSYLISRRVNGGDGPFAFVSSEGATKTFIDSTLPVGVDKVEYIVQPKRGSDVGPQSPVFAVQFGSVGGGGMAISTASVPHNEDMKIAA